MPQLLEIRYFVAAAENGSLRRAAEVLGTGQSGVSRKITSLENRLGVSLFERSNIGVRLTNAGRRFLDDVRPVLKQIEKARRSARSAGRAEAGAVRIGVVTSLAGGFIRKLLITYRQDYPEVCIDVRDGGCDEHMVALRSRELDIAFLPGWRSVRNCECVELWKERVHVALSANHKLAGQDKLDWPDLREEQFITSSIWSGPEVHDYIVKRLADHAFFPKVEARCACFETLMNLVSLGEGLSVTSATWAFVKLPDLVIRPLVNPKDVLPFSAFWLAENDNPALRCLVSTAHVLAGRVRRGNSDWLPRQITSDEAPGSTSANARTRDLSP